MSTTPSSCSNIMYVRRSCSERRDVDCVGGVSGAVAGAELGSAVVALGERRRTALLGVGATRAARRRRRRPAPCAGATPRGVDRPPDRTPSAALASKVPSARRTASSTARSTSQRSRKRTSAFAGCTFTSTESAGDDDVEKQRGTHARRESSSDTPLRRRARCPVSRIGAAVHGEEHASARGADVGGPLDEPAHVHRARARRRRRARRSANARPTAPATRSRSDGARRAASSAGFPSCVTVKPDVAPRERDRRHRVDDRRATRSARRAGISGAPARCRRAATTATVVPRRRATSRTSVTTPPAARIERARAVGGRRLDLELRHRADRGRAPRRGSRSCARRRGPARVRIFDVAWRSSASSASSRVHAGAVVAHADELCGRRPRRRRRSPSRRRRARSRRAP